MVSLLASASAVQAQRLLTLVPGVGQAASVGGLGPSIGPVPTAVQVDLDLLRSAPARLETPTPEGGVLSALRSVFEDRGGGDLMWSGGQPGAGYDTVVLTVEGGRLVGRFGAAGGGVYQIHADADGRGGMAPLVGPDPDGPVPLCGVEAGAGHFHDGLAHVASDAPPADPPERVSNPQSHDRLDILVAYTATAAENWAYLGGPVAAIRHAVDYMKMVFRNNRVEVEPHLVHIAQASSALDRAGRDLGLHLAGRFPLSAAFNRDGDLRQLRHEHRADIVHLFTGERAALLGACGAAFTLSRHQTARSYSPHADAWTSNTPHNCQDYAATFVHEIGHNLGAHHDPPNVRYPGSLIRPFAMGHADLDVMPTLGTAMSFRGQTVPFFSTPRIRPYGAILGIADERDNERTLQETVHIGVQYSDYLRPVEGLPAPPSALRVRFGGGAAHLAWRDNAPDADGYEVQYWYTTRAGTELRLRRLTGRTEAVFPLDSTESGARYLFQVRATRGDERSLRSNIVEMVVPGDPIAAPSDVSVTVEGNAAGIGIQWTDNSDNETSFDVQLLEDGDPIHREKVPEDSERLWIGASRVLPRGGAEYGVRVFAYNSAGYSESSDVAVFRWGNPGGSVSVTGLSVRPTGSTSVRVAWTADTASYFGYYVSASLPFWRDDRVWERPGHSGPAWMDFEGLARGGRYAFDVRPKFGVSSRVYLTLGERGGGPRPPSDVAWAIEGDRVRLSWKDNSSDELGFEVQDSAGGGTLVGGTRWRRLLTVPADTESVVYESTVLGRFVDGRFRVFAYNDRGYSRASMSSGSCRPDKETLCLRDSRFSVRVIWWKADGERTYGRVVDERTADSGLFWFIDPENWEILIKVLDGCRINGRMWVLGASTTDLGYVINVTDTIAQESRKYRNQPGQPAPAIVDTKAFSVACVDGAAP